MFAAHAQAQVSQHHTSSTRGGLDALISGATEILGNNTSSHPGSSSSSHGHHVMGGGLSTSGRVVEMDGVGPDDQQEGAHPQEAPDDRPRGRGAGGAKAKAVYGKDIVMMDEDLRAQLTVLCDDVIKAMKVGPSTSILSDSTSPHPQSLHLVMYNPLCTHPCLSLLKPCCCRCCCRRRCCSCCCCCCCCHETSRCRAKLCGSYHPALPWFVESTPTLPSLRTCTCYRARRCPPPSIASSR